MDSAPHQQQQYSEQSRNSETGNNSTTITFETDGDEMSKRKKYSSNPTEVSVPPETPPPPSKSRWLSPEFIFYYIVLGVVYLFQIKVLLEKSEPYNTGEKFTNGIEDGWIPGRKMDLSDAQWHTWRSFFPFISLGIAIFVCISNYLKGCISPYGRIVYYNIAAVCLLLFLHGTTSIYIYTVALINYAIAKSLGRSRLLPYTTWGFNILILGTSYVFHGYTFKTFVGSYLGEIMDAHRGILDWQIYFKISFLRFISFNMDHYWMSINREVPSLKNRTPYFIAQEQHLAKTQYDLPHFLSYVFYAPLYVAGPIISYNAFINQVYTPQTTHSFKQLIMSTIKILLILLGFEITLHYVYFYAFNENDLWKDFYRVDICITGYFVLNFMYHKFLIIWRIFRLGALFDGVDTPENMNRCVSNNYTFTGFWRSWHGSFNMWTVRYLYIPLGGKKTQRLTIWLVFIFIGLWHDLWWSWVAWALLNCVFFSGEILVMTFFHRRSWIERKPYYNHLVAAAGSFNVFLLMVANLAILHGFGDSAVFIQHAFFVEGGFVTFLGAWAWLFCGVMIMGEIRESEKRNADVKRF